MTEKELFIENMKARTKKFAVDVIRFVELLNHYIINILSYSKENQFIKTQ